MSNVTITQNMGLALPVVGGELGPQYASDNNGAFTVIDGHDHSSGSGVAITPNGLNINADLPLNNNDLTLVNTVNFTALSASLPGLSPNLGCIYVAGNELYYNDEVGNVVQMTNSGSVNSGAGSITGLPSGTASASYSPGSETFIWQSATSTPANMDFGSAIIREVAPSAKGITLQSPSALSADYALTFMSALPASQKIVTIDNSGAIAANYVVDNSTIEIVSNTIQVKDLGITTQKLANASVTRPKMAAVGQQVSASSGNIGLTSNTSFIGINNLTVTITTTGRPVMLMIQSDGSGNPSYLENRANAQANFRFFRTTDSFEVARYYDDEATSTAPTFYKPSSIFAALDFNVAAGTWTYEMQCFVGAGQTAGIQYAVLVAYEL